MQRNHLISKHGFPYKVFYIALGTIEMCGSPCKHPVFQESHQLLFLSIQLSKTMFFSLHSR